MLKRKILQIVGCVGLTVMAMSPAMAFDVEITEGMTKILDMSAPDNAKFSNVLKAYDFDNAVPPSVETLIKQVGAQDELQVFIPEKSRMYFYYFSIDHPIATEFRKKFFFGVGNNSKEVKLASNLSMGLVNAKSIKNMDFYSNGVLLTLDIKESPLTVIEIDPRDSIYSVKYTFADSKVLKVELMTNVSNESKTKVDKEAMQYVLNSYKEFLKNKGYTNKSLWGREEDVYKKDNSVIMIDNNTKGLPDAYVGYLIPALAVMTIYDKEIYENYENIENDIKNKEMAKKFNRLDQILNK